MQHKSWMFLSNHGLVFAYVAKHPKSTAEEIARRTNLSLRAVQAMLSDFEKGGYLEKQREGRCNRYIIHPELPLRHRLVRNHSVGELLRAVGSDAARRP